MRFHVAVLLPCLSSACLAADPALTVYNQQFAVVRETIRLDLKPGLNQVQFTGTSAQLEPQSVMLARFNRAASAAHPRAELPADPISRDALMKRYEGQTIDFQVHNGDRVETVSGKIVRASAFVPAQSLKAQPPVLRTTTRRRTTHHRDRGKTALRPAGHAAVSRSWRRYHPPAHARLDDRN